MYTDKNEYICAGNEIHKYIKNNFPDAELDYDDDIIQYADASAFARYIVGCFKRSEMNEVKRCLDVTDILFDRNEQYEKAIFIKRCQEQI